MFQVHVAMQRSADQQPNIARVFRKQLTLYAFELLSRYFTQIGLRSAAEIKRHALETRSGCVASLVVVPKQRWQRFSPNVDR